jgi:hypothetical protein
MVCSAELEHRVVVVGRSPESSERRAVIRCMSFEL